MLSEQVKQTLVETINECVNASFIMLFGSHAKGTSRENSDVDLAYYSQNLLSPYEQFILSGKLAQICGTDVDLVNIREIDTVFAIQIFENGQLLSCKDENEFIKQRMKAFSMYAALNEQRAEVLRGIQERGSVFDDE